MNRRVKYLTVQFRNLEQLYDLTRLVKAVRNIQLCRWLVILLLGLVVKEQRVTNEITHKKLFPILVVGGGSQASVNV